MSNIYNNNLAGFPHPQLLDRAGQLERQYLEAIAKQHKAEDDRKAFMRMLAEAMRPVIREELEAIMATKSVGRATVKTDAAGKIRLSVPDTTPAHFKIAKRNKATRKAKGLVKNREAKR